MSITPRVQPLGNGRLELRVNPGDWSATSLSAPPKRGRGRPAGMTVQELLERIRKLAKSRDSLFRVHHRNPSLYARARRRFGSWSAALQAAGLDYREAMTWARQRSIQSRRRRSRRARLR